MIDTMESSSAWAERMVGGLPKRWERNLLQRWEHQRASGDRDFVRQVAAERTANIELREVAASLYQIRLPLDASDDEVCVAADQLAGRAQELRTLYRTEEELHAALVRVARGQAVQPPKVKDQDKDLPPAIARMSCPIWWRRQLRRVHAQHVEGAAIRLGYVNRARDIYASNESVQRRQQQNDRNAASLEATIATNENGDEYTLAELAAKGTANKAIRRAELMTRIAGFERIAMDLGHAGLFLTITCPSRMHKFSTAKNGKGVFENRRYDGTLPGAANKYLGQVWARTRTALARLGVSLYGFRIAEPQHDGTPHWHLLVFHAPERYADIEAAIWKQALKDSPDEPGARAHRCDFKPIDPGKGTAAGYIAKYVAKNIDGYRLQTDLIGGQEIVADGFATAQRVEAWASTWGIRQFQQVGGPPVGPWRELRRVQAIPQGAPAHLRQAHDAANRIADMEAGTVKAVAWDRYVKAQGGVFCGRAYKVRVTKVDPEQTGRYGEAMPPKPVGVEAEGVEVWTPEWMAHISGKAERVVHWFVESVRHVWTIARSAVRRVLDVQKPGLAGPWTRVNNCTEGRKNFEKNELERAAPGHQREFRTGKRNMGISTGTRQGNGGGLRGPSVVYAGGIEHGNAVTL